MSCMNPRGHGAFRAFAHPTWSALAILVTATIAAQTAALAQGLEVKGLDVKRYNPSEWTKGRFSEVVTVTGPGKTIYLAGVGAEDENAPAGASAPIRHLGNPYEQCRYAYDKIKRLLATHGASLADAVKQVVYVTASPSAGGRLTGMGRSRPIRFSSSTRSPSRACCSRST
jgi:enamine deaminase RidA (YjgF/YER057c/UK114 family)